MKRVTIAEGTLVGLKGQVARLRKQVEQLRGSRNDWMGIARTAEARVKKLEATFFAAVLSNGGTLKITPAAIREAGTRHELIVTDGFDGSRTYIARRALDTKGGE